MAAADMPSMQKKIRDLERLLKRKIENEFEASQIRNKIEVLHNENDTNKLHLKQKKNARKYHMVRFFERKKCTRKIKSLDTEISNLKENLLRTDESSIIIKIKNDIADFEKKRKDAEDDLTYVLYYPKEWKYIGLFAKDSDEKQLQAREIAIQRRHECIQIGQKDMVTHAIDVEYGLVRDNVEQDCTNDGISQDLEQDGLQELNYEKRKRKRINDPGESMTVELTNSSNQSNSNFVEKGNKIYSEPVVTTQQKEELDDPFFVEETELGSTQGANGIVDLRGAVLRRGKGWKNRTKPVLNTDGLSKQETRLKQWQNKVRNRRVAY